MHVTGLWRYPVKSMRGETQEHLDVARHGVVGDRRFGILDPATGTIISAKKDGRLLEARAMLAGIELTIRLPNGETALSTGPAVDAALSAWLNRPVHLVEARPDGRGTFQMPEDFEDDESEPVAWQGPYGTFHDSAPVHVLTTASLRALTSERADLQWDVARFRPNILIEVPGQELVEHGWISSRIRMGETELAVYKACSRCVMTTRSQPRGIERQLDILRHVNAAHDGQLGVLARVVTPGRVECGQSVTVTE